MKRIRTSRRARFATIGAAAAAVGVFASLGGVGYAAGLVHLAHSSPTAAQYPQSKVTICHHTHSQTNPFVTITVSVHALPAHLGHGDTIGPCPAQGATGAQGATESPTKVHSNRGHHGDKGHANGKGKPTSPATANHGQGNHGQGNQGQGQGHGHGQGPGGTHGNSGGGKGNGHKP